MSDVVTRLETPVAALKVEADLVWSGVGAAFAHADAGQQVEFLLGMSEGFRAIGLLGTGLQFAFIAEAMPNPRASGDAAVLLDGLQDHLKVRSEGLS